MKINEVQSVIERKVQGEGLTRGELIFIVEGYHKHRVSDELMAEFLTAVKSKGLDLEETVWLTEAIAGTGDQIEWGATSVAGRVLVDEPSTGGVGNKSPLIVPPILAAAGLVVPKMSSRGSVAGTIDILESIGYVADLPKSEFIRIVESLGLSNICQTDELAPVDARLMALRRKTGTMKQPSLVVSSILSKKLATGCDHLVIDVKAGEDSKFGDYNATYEGAKLFVEAGKLLGLKVIAVVTDNDNPQGTYIGRRLSLVEVLEVLKGRGPADQRETCYFLAAQSFLLAGIAETPEDANRKVIEAVDSEAAFGKFMEQLMAHQADMDLIRHPVLLQNSNYRVPLISDQTGYVARISARQVDECTKFLLRNTQQDGASSSGIVLRRQVGDRVEAGEVLAVIHAEDHRILEEAKRLLHDAFVITETRAEPKPQILAVASEQDGLRVFWKP